MASEMDRNRLIPDFQQQFGSLKPHLIFQESRNQREKQSIYQLILKLPSASAQRAFYRETPSSTP